MSFNVKIMGADQAVDNVSGNDYVSTLQVAQQRSRVFKMTFSPLAGMAADVYVWIFDSATAATTKPKVVRYVPAGVADTWDPGAGGALFTNGIYVALSTVPPTDGTTVVTGPGNNKIIVRADVRQG